MALGIDVSKMAAVGKNSSNAEAEATLKQWMWQYIGFSFLGNKSGGNNETIADNMKTKEGWKNKNNWKFHCNLPAANLISKY